VNVGRAAAQPSRAATHYAPHVIRAAAHLTHQLVCDVPQIVIYWAQRVAARLGVSAQKGIGSLGASLTSCATAAGATRATCDASSSQAAR